MTRWHAVICIGVLGWLLLFPILRLMWHICTVCNEAVALW